MAAVKYLKALKGCVRRNCPPYLPGLATAIGDFDLLMTFQLKTALAISLPAAASPTLVNSPIPTITSTPMPTSPAIASRSPSSPVLAPPLLPTLPPPSQLLTPPPPPPPPVSLLSLVACCFCQDGCLTCLSKPSDAQPYPLLFV